MISVLRSRYTSLKSPHVCIRFFTKFSHGKSMQFTANRPNLYGNRSGYWSGAPKYSRLRLRGKRNGNAWTALCLESKLWTALWRVNNWLLESRYSSFQIWTWNKKARWKSILTWNKLKRLRKGTLWACPERGRDSPTGGGPISNVRLDIIWQSTPSRTDLINNHRARHQ